tara:strand:- start:124 stop:411 length:288 start_codon:yes stop_codon:yes gene_type:complete
MSTKSKTIRIPKQFASIPEKPKNGNYIFSGQNRWCHAESFSDAYKIFRDDGGNYRGELFIVDASDDFRIYHVDGSVRAEKLDAVWVSWEGGLQNK